MVLTEKESSVLKLVTESLKENNRYFHRVALTLDEMLFRLNLEQPKISKNSFHHSSKGEFPYNGSTRNVAKNTT
jgi:hypothetical protein